MTVSGDPGADLPKERPVRTHDALFSTEEPR
jgi:hypothetical protein